MITIYEPQGKAREYSPLALNIYKGCDHHCFYCYVPDMLSRFNKDYIHSSVSPRENILKEFVTSAKKYRGTEKQVLLSFTSDPYCSTDEKYGLTREALKILLEYEIPTAILTKGGKRCLRDMDLFKQFPKESFKIGTTLTYFDDGDSLKNESGAAVYSERASTLKTLYENNIQTWVSIEPVIIPSQSLRCMSDTIEYVNHYKIGKLNHFPQIEKNINWNKFLNDSVSIMRKYNKDFYIKDDLRKFNEGYGLLKSNEMNMDYLNVKRFPDNNLF